MADRRGQARALTVLTPILNGREQALRAALAELPAGHESPLARLPGTHFARWVVVPHRGLLFSATYDAGDFDYIDEIRSRIPEAAGAVWGHCDGYPGVDDGFADYLRRHRVRTGLFVGAYPDAGLEEIKAALALRRRLIRFVLRAQSLPSDELRAAFGEARLV